MVSLNYLEDILMEMKKQWPQNRTINIVCHGHSVPSGYFATPFVNTFHAYPHLLHQMIKERFPFAVTNVIVTGIGGERSNQGCLRFEEDVLCHKPDVLTIDYGLNDRQIGLEEAKKSWEKMIEAALEREIKVVLLTPSWDQSYWKQDESWHELVRHAEQIKALAEKYQVGLADSFGAFQRAVQKPEDLTALLSHINHPSEKGHRLIAEELAKYFIAQ